MTEWKHCDECTALDGCEAHGCLIEACGGVPKRTGETTDAFKNTTALQAPAQAVHNNEVSHNSLNSTTSPTNGNVGQDDETKSGLICRLCGAVWDDEVGCECAPV